MSRPRGIVGNHLGKADDGAAYTSGDQQAISRRGIIGATSSTVSAALVKGEPRDLDPAPGYQFRPYVYGGARSRFALRALAAQPPIAPGQ